jgi:hypothetical protein
LSLSKLAFIIFLFYPGRYNVPRQRRLNQRTG